MAGEIVNDRAGLGPNHLPASTAGRSSPIQTARPGLSAGSPTVKVVDRTCLYQTPARSSTAAAPPGGNRSRAATPMPTSGGSPNSTRSTARSPARSPARPPASSAPAPSTASVTRASNPWPPSPTATCTTCGTPSPASQRRRGAVPAPTRSVQIAIWNAAGRSRSGNPATCGSIRSINGSRPPACRRSRTPTGPGPGTPQYLSSPGRRQPRDVRRTQAPAASFPSSTGSAPRKSARRQPPQIQQRQLLRHLRRTTLGEPPAFAVVVNPPVRSPAGPEPASSPLRRSPCGTAHLLPGPIQPGCFGVHVEGIRRLCLTPPIHNFWLYFGTAPDADVEA